MAYFSSSAARLRVLPGGQRDDRGLLQRAASGDERAVREIYVAHAGRVRRTVARVLGAQDPEIDDVVQRVFLAALDGAA
ncbi:MAG: hypothetical protein AAF594_18630, partial [Bacteroidota bacterium]